MRFTRGDVRDHIESSKIDQGSFVAALNTRQQERSPKNQPSRDFSGRLIFDFCNSICQKLTSIKNVGPSRQRPVSDVWPLGLSSTWNAEVAATGVAFVDKCQKDSASGLGDKLHSDIHRFGGWNEDPVDPDCSNLDSVCPQQFPRFA
jgi:hypothetical protein